MNDALDPQAAENVAPDHEDAQAAGVAPKRSKLRSIIAPVAVALALTGGAGAFLVVPQGTQNLDAVAPVEQRAASLSRDVERTPLPAASKPATSVSPAVVADWSKASVKVSPKPKPTAEATAVAKKSAPAKQAASTKKATAKKATAKKAATKTSAKKAATTKAAVSYAGPKKSTVGSSAGRALGLTPFASTVYADVRSNFSGIKSAGGYRSTSRSVHQYGRAMDLMLTPGKQSALGWAIARYAAANAGRFKIDHIIFEQKIWTPYRPYWRPMEDRGSITQNHYDHVHIATKA